MATYYGQGSGFPAAVPLEWKRAANGFVPQHAIVGGNQDGHPMLVGRMYFKGDHPGSYGSVCSIGYGGKEIVAEHDFEVLTADDRLVEWITRTSRALFKSAVIGGSDTDGQDIYIARCRFKGDWVPGKAWAHKSHASFGSNGLEMSSAEDEPYQLLCFRDFSKK